MPWDTTEPNLSPLTQRGGKQRPRGEGDLGLEAWPSVRTWGQLAPISRGHVPLQSDTEMKQGPWQTDCPWPHRGLPMPQSLQ